MQPAQQPQVQSQVQSQPQPISISSEAQPQIQPQAIPMQQVAQPQIQGQVIPMQPMQNMGGMPTTNALLALILACVSLVFGGICLSIPALIIANGALKITSQYPGHPDQSNANTARIVSIISIILYTIFIIVYAIFIFAFLASAPTY